MKDNAANSVYSAHRVARCTRTGHNRSQENSSLVDLNAHRAVVRAFHGVADEGALQTRAQGRADEEVIDAPAHISRARAGHRAPPGVMPATLLELPEGVEETRLHKPAETGPFFGRETVVLHVGLRIGQINFGVRHVEITAENHRLAALKLFEVTQKVA